MTHRLNPASRHRRGAIMVLAAFIDDCSGGLDRFLGGLWLLAEDSDRLAALGGRVRAGGRAGSHSKAGRHTRLEQGPRDGAGVRRDNLADSSFQVATADIQIGRYDPQTIYTNLTLLNTGTFDTVRVTLRRDGATNPNVPLFFARLLGTQTATVTARATAILQKGEYMGPGVEILPFATPLDLWNSLSPGDEWTAYGDGKLKDGSGNDVPGNWGTCDIGHTNNSSSELNDQILNGLRQEDLNALQTDGRISQSDYIDSSQPLWTQGDTGLSSGLKQSVTAVHGKQKLIPIYDQLANPTGSHVDFHVVGWGVVTVVDSDLAWLYQHLRPRAKVALVQWQVAPKSSLSASQRLCRRRLHISHLGGVTDPRAGSTTP